MANVLAGLVVNLGLNATEYSQGLTKAEYQAKKFSQSFSSGMSSVKTALGGLGIGLVVNEIVELGKNIVSTAAELNDFADQTGSSVEALSKLANQAAIAGTPFEELQQATLKLAVAMGGTDEKSKSVAEIFKTLGVTAKDPAEAMQQIAVALNKYQDGATKAAYAQELFGKSGAKFLATLKDIANLQDVVATTTTKQAEEAEKLEQAYRRLGVEATTFKNAILDDVVPVLLRLVTEFNAARKAGLGFWEALSIVGTGQVSMEDRIVSATEKLEEERKAFAAATRFGTAGLPFTGSEKKVKDAEKELEVLRKMQAATADFSFLNKDKTKPELPPRPEKGRTQAERISDAQRYLESLQRQLQKTEDLTVEETLLADIQSGRLKMSADVSEDQLRAVARQIDAAHDLIEADKELQKFAEERMRVEEEQDRITQKIEQDRQHQLDQLEAEAEALAKDNEQLRRHTEEIGLDATSLAKLNQERIDSEILIKAETAARFRAQIGMEDEAAAVEKQIAALRERKSLLTRQGIAEQMAADTAKATEINELFVNSFAEGAASISKNAKSIGDAVKMMSTRIVDAFTQIAAKNIGTALFGAATSSGGGGIFSAIGPFIAKMLGAGGGGSGAGWVSGFDLAGMAGGGSVAANQPYMVGERGPELFVPKTSGTIVPSGKGGGSVIHQTINVLPGASTRSASQAAMAAGLAAQRALAKNA